MHGAKQKGWRVLIVNQSYLKIFRKNVLLFYLSLILLFFAIIGNKIMDHNGVLGRRLCLRFNESRKI